MKPIIRKLFRGIAIALVCFLLTVTMVWCIDSLTGKAYDRAIHPVVIAKNPNPNRLIVHLPGFVSNKWATEALAEHLDGYGTLMGFPFPEGKLVPEKLFEAIQNQLNKQRTAYIKEVWVLAQSMGAKVFRDFAAWLRDNDVQLLLWLRNVTVKLVLDTAPACEDDIKAPSLGLRIAETLDWVGLDGGKWTTFLAIRPWQKAQLKSYPTPSGVSLKTLTEGQKAFTNTSMTAITSQLAYLSRYMLPSQQEIGELRRLVDEAIFVSGEGPSDDPVIHIDRAITNWYGVFPTMRRETVSNWDPGDHSPNLERPAKYAKIVIEAFA